MNLTLEFIESLFRVYMMMYASMNASCVGYDSFGFYMLKIKMVDRKYIHATPTTTVYVHKHMALLHRNMLTFYVHLNYRITHQEHAISR